jgi:predicted MFS family arabinose efflux permease
MVLRYFNVVTQGEGGDFWKFWIGQIISTLGSSITSFALPLLVFKLTGSAMNLGLAFAANLLPYLFFGLIIGAWVDRVDRKRLMIITDFLSMLMIGTLPVLNFLGLLSIWWIYVTLFVNSTLSIFFSSAAVAAVPCLVGKDDLMAANGRIQAGYSFASVIGPLLAALLLNTIPLPALLLLDALSFLVSVISLLLVKTSFNVESDEEKKPTSIFQDILEGLRYILGERLTRWITVMLVLVNLIVPTIFAEFVLFAKQVVAVSDSQLGVLYAVGSVGVVMIGLSAGRLSKLWSFSVIALGSLMLQGVLTIVTAFVHWFWIVLPLWAIITSMSSLFNINIASLYQATVPNHLLGRLSSFIRMLAWSTSPLGVLAGGFVIERTHNVTLVYAGLGLLAFLVPFAFVFTPVGRVRREKLR